MAFVDDDEPSSLPLPLPSSTITASDHDDDDESNSSDDSFVSIPNHDDVEARDSIDLEKDDTTITPTTITMAPPSGDGDSNTTPPSSKGTAGS